jgi:hypothetical protein
MKKAAISFADERAIGQGTSAVFLAMVLTLAGCFPMVEGDGFNAEDWKWDAGGGKVYIRIDLNASRFAVDLDNPTQDHAVYFEAVFKEEGTTNYYTGAAAAGERFCQVSDYLWAKCGIRPYDPAQNRRHPRMGRKYRTVYL